jgi:hypothetical protein
VPYITVGLEVRADPRWLEIPAPTRAKAKALYLDALSYSAELLTNGHVPRSVLGGIAFELGIERPQKVMRFLVDSGHATVTETGLFLNEWEQFHDSRETVQRRRTDAAKRKRASRAQTRLPMSHTKSQRDNGASHSETDVVTRARASAPAKQETEPEEDLSKAVDLQPAAAGEADDEPDLDNAPSANGTAQGFNIDQIKPTLREMP